MGKWYVQLATEIGIIVCNSKSTIMFIKSGGYDYITHRWHAFLSAKLIAMTVNEANLYLPKLGITEYEVLSVNIDDEHNRHNMLEAILINCQIENPDTDRLWLTLIYNTCQSKTTLVWHNTDLKTEKNLKKKNTIKKKYSIDLFDFLQIYLIRLL